MSSPRRRPSSLVGLAVLAAAVAVRAEPTEKPKENQDFWSRIAHPDQQRYGQLVTAALSYEHDNSYVQALPFLREAIGLDPSEPLGFYLLARALAGVGQWSECADAIATVEKLRPGYVPTDGPPTELDDQAGICLSLSGRFDEAIDRYKRVLAASPPTADLPTVHWNLGDCYQALGSLDEAVDEYSLGISINPRHVMLRFALGVALDRDEESRRARDEIARGLELDPQLEQMASPGTFYLPDSDKLYYFAVAHQVAADADPGRRALAIAWFRKYLAAGPSPWLKRARAHLAELGSPVLGPAEVAVAPDLAERPALLKAVIGAGPELQKCLAGQTEAVVRATLILVPAVMPPAPAGTRKVSAKPVESFTAASAGPEPAPAEAAECIEQHLRALKLKVSQVTKLQIMVIAR